MTSRKIIATSMTMIVVSRTLVCGVLAEFGSGRVGGSPAVGLLGSSVHDGTRTVGVATRGGVA